MERYLQITENKLLKVCYFSQEKYYFSAVFNRLTLQNQPKCTKIVLFFEQNDTTYCKKHYICTYKIAKCHKNRKIIDKQ